MALQATGGVGLDQALAQIAATAGKRDRDPAFPRDAFSVLAEAGVLVATVPEPGASRLSIAEEWDLVRRVAAADSSVGRILDGHLNAVDRITVAAHPEVREEQLNRVSAEHRLLGVWGADPGPGEGEPARLSGPVTEPGLSLTGVKVFCSGAGGVDAALVMVRQHGDGPPSLVLADIDETVEIDRRWFAASGLRSSESHRVVFRDTPVRAVLGEPGELAKDPWFSQDAMRTASSWAGMADAAAAAALGELSARRATDPVAQLAAGRIRAAEQTIDNWLEAGARAAQAGAELRELSVSMRVEISRAALTILEEAARACGSHPFATGAALDRVSRDLRLFLLQHRLDPLTIKSGKSLLVPSAGSENGRR